MTRTLLPMHAFAVVAALAGLTLLLTPGRIRRALRLPDTTQAGYALRIVGMMLTALGVFLAGFATIFVVAGGQG